MVQGQDVTLNDRYSAVDLAGREHPKEPDAGSVPLARPDSTPVNPKRASIEEGCRENPGGAHKLSQFTVDGARTTSLIFTLSLIGPDRRGSHDIHWGGSIPGAAESPTHRSIAGPVLLCTACAVEGELGGSWDDRLMGGKIILDGPIDMLL